MPNEQLEIDQGFFKDDDPRARTKNGVFAGRNMLYDIEQSGKAVETGDGWPESGEEAF